MAISNYTASNDHVPSPFIATKHAHVFVPFVPLTCQHLWSRGFHVLLPLVDATVQRPQWYVSMPLFFTCPITTSPTLPHLIPYRNQPIEQLIPLLQRRHPILLTTLINNDNPILNLSVRRPSDNNPSLPT